MDKLCPCRRGATLTGAGGGGWNIGGGEMGLVEDSRDGCGETEAEYEWEFCACWSLLSLKYNRVGSAGDDIYREIQVNNRGREDTTY